MSRLHFRAKTKFPLIYNLITLIGAKTQILLKTVIRFIVKVLNYTYHLCNNSHNI